LSFKRHISLKAAKFGTKSYYANPVPGMSVPTLFTHGRAWNYITFVNANIKLQL
jgi:hypothetical protein